MKKTRCLLVDDEPLAIALLQKHIGQLDFLEVSATCPNAMNALEALKQQEIDLLFLDIRMPQISGIDFLKTLKHPPKTIITTAYREYAVDGYDLDIIDYLLKPITFDRFFKSVERYLRNSGQISPAIQNIAENRVISIKSGYKNLKIDLSDIQYIESSKDYIKIQTKEKEIVAKYKISEIDAELAGKGFLRIHRSYIINLKHLAAFTAHDVEIGSKEIPIGESYKELVFKIFNK